MVCRCRFRVPRSWIWMCSQASTAAASRRCTSAGANASWRARITSSSEKPLIHSRTMNGWPRQLESAWLPTRFGWGAAASRSTLRRRSSRGLSRSSSWTATARCPRTSSARKIGLARRALALVRQRLQVVVVRQERAEQRDAGLRLPVLARIGLGPAVVVSGPLNAVD